MCQTAARVFSKRTAIHTREILCLKGNNMSRCTAKQIKEALQSIELNSVIHIEKRKIACINKIISALNYRIPKPVTEHIQYLDSVVMGVYAIEICPTCDWPIAKNYQKYCSVCGQHLKWISVKKMKLKEN